MPYVVRVEVGKGKNRAVTQSIPLPNKKRMCAYIQRNPLIRSNTKFKVTNIKTGKSEKGNEAHFYSKYCRKKIK